MNWLTQLFSRHTRYDELSESIREHVDEKISDLMDRGMTREEAERTARREFDNVTLIEERSREVWQWPKIESIWADVKFASRQLRRSPGFTLVALLTDVLQLSGLLAGDVKESRNDNPTRDLQMASDRTRPHSLCGTVVSSLFSVAAQC